MTTYIAAYKAPGKITDKVVKAALSVRHGKPVIYSHVELLKSAPYYARAGVDKLTQECIAASKRDDSCVRRKVITFRKGHWDFINLNIHPEVHLWAEAETRIGIPYDIIGAAFCITPLARLHLDKEWCSGMIADIAEWDEPEAYDPYMIVQKALSLGGVLTEG